MHKYLMAALFTFIISCPISLAFAQESDSGFSQEKVDKLNKEVDLLYNQVKESKEKLKALANVMTAKKISDKEKEEGYKRLENEMTVMAGYESKLDEIQAEVEDEYKKLTNNAVNLDDE